MALVNEGRSGKIPSGDGAGNRDGAPRPWNWQCRSGGPFDQLLKPRILPQRIEGWVDPEPAGREVVGDLEQRLQPVHRLVRLTDEDVDPHQLELVIWAAYRIFAERIEGDSAFSL